MDETNSSVTDSNTRQDHCVSLPFSSNILCCDGGDTSSEIVLAGKPSSLRMTARILARLLLFVSLVAVKKLEVSPSMAAWGSLEVAVEQPMPCDVMGHYVVRINHRGSFQAGFDMI